MSSVVKNKKVSREEFLAYLDSIEGKVEFLNGEIRVKPSGTPNHSLIAGNIGSEIGQALKGSDCGTYAYGLLLETPADLSLIFPDVQVICRPIALTNDRKDIVTNPLLVVEVLSHASADYDRGEKFFKYMTVKSLREYVLVDQYSTKVDVFYRTDSGLWDISSYTDINASVYFQSIKVTVPMAEIYSGVVFD